MTIKILHIQQEKDLMDWAKRLKMFRYVTSKGGLGDDNGDKFVCAFSYSSTLELEQFFEFVGHKLNVFTEEPPQPKIVKGELYSTIDRTNVPDVIPNTNWIEQPKHIDINGVRAFVWCTFERIEISPYEKSSTWTVTEESVKKGETIEILLKKSPLSLIEPPVDSEFCLCQKHYPAYFF